MSLRAKKRIYCAGYRKALHKKSWTAVILIKKTLRKWTTRSYAGQDLLELLLVVQQRFRFPQRPANISKYLRTSTWSLLILFQIHPNNILLLDAKNLIFRKLNKFWSYQSHIKQLLWNLFNLFNLLQFTGDFTVCGILNLREKAIEKFGKICI